MEKVPQDNDTILKGAFTYKLIVEHTPYVPVDPATIDLSPAGTASLTNAQQLIERTNQAHSVQILQTNSHDLRLTFRWPILPNDEVGNRRVIYRAFTGGWLLPTFDPYENSQRLFFFQSSTYVP